MKVPIKNLHFPLKNTLICIARKVMSHMNKNSEPKSSTPTSKNKDYYFEDGLLIMTEAYHLRRGSCCGMKCRHCPFGHKNVVNSEE